LCYLRLDLRDLVHDHLGHIKVEIGLVF